MGKLATSKNLTILGIVVIIGALANAARAFLDGDPSTVVNLEALFGELALGIGFIAAKGAASTGGTVPETPEAVKRIGG